MVRAQVLAENGVDLGACDADGCTALHVAAACGRAEAACLLLSLPDADVRLPCPRVRSQRTNTVCTFSSLFGAALCMPCIGL